ncbi:hypothetical protein PMAYCL1PPCAC_13164, partial [Pristionchus mayeri]
TTLKAMQLSTNHEIPKMVLRPLIPDHELPETVGPDSPLRHHPKYQKKNQDAAIDFMLGQSLAVFNLSSAPSDPKDSGTRANNNPVALKKMLDSFMDEIIKNELVA